MPHRSPSPGTRSKSRYPIARRPGRVALLLVTAALLALPAAPAAAAPAVGAAPAAPPAAVQRPSRYVALGDSYSSGNAAGWYWDTTCFNSHLNYASRLGWELFVRGKPGYAMTQAPSCSGAQTGRATPPYGATEGGYFSPQEQRPGYVRAAQRDFLTHVYERDDGTLGTAFDGAEVGLVTITIGGNDIGFADTISACTIELTPCSDREPATLEAVARLGPVLQEVYADIAAQAPNAQIRVVNYPAPVSTATAPYCRSLSADAGIGISDAEVAFFARAQDALNAQIAAAVTAVRATAGDRLRLVDAATHFRGHEACAGSSDWMRGIWLVPGYTEESYHVNDRGHLEIARLVADSL